MTDQLPTRAARSDSDIRLRASMVAGALLLVVLGVAYLLVPTEWTSGGRLALWTLPAVVVAAGVVLTSTQYVLETIHFLRDDTQRLRELTKLREHERDLAQEELV